MLQIYVFCYVFRYVTVFITISCYLQIKKWGGGGVVVHVLRSDLSKLWSTKYRETRHGCISVFRVSYV